MTLNEIREHIEGLNFINEGDQVVLALSGGPDSACLFYALNQMKDKLGITINCVHVNHGLRGVESNADEDFVREICRQNNCPLTVVSTDVASLAKVLKISTEETGRKVRYQAFYEETDKVYKETGKFPSILVAHNMDDQAETILFRIIRGTGITGLRAMQKYEITSQGYEIIRPLLDISKRDILEALQSEGLPYCEDKTNELPIYARNKIRLDIIPAMESINPAIKEAVVRLGEIADEQYEFLEIKAHQCIEKLKRENKIILTQSITMVSTDELRPYHVVVQKRVFSQIIKRMGLFENISYKHLEALVALLKSENPSTGIDLPYGFKACRIYGEIGIFSNEIFSKKNLFEMCISTADKLPENIAEKGHVKVANSNKAVNSDEYTQNIHWQFENRYLHFIVFLSKEVFEQKYGKSKKPVLRYRQPGDYMILKDGGRKKIKNIFVDDKIPRILRNRIPLLAVGSEIIWIADLTGRSNGRLSGDFQIENLKAKNCGELGNTGWFRIDIFRD